MTRRAIVEDHGLPLISIGKDDGWLAPIASEPLGLARSAGHVSGAESGTGQPYVTVFLVLCILAGAELGIAIAYRGSLFASAAGLGAVCFYVVAKRLWAALA